MPQKKKSSPKKKRTSAATSSRSNVLRVGIDLGTSRSAISASNGKRKWVESYVGWPKDFISEKVLGEPVLFGAHALENRLSLDLYRPLAHGVIKEGTSRDEEAVRELVAHLLDMVEVKVEQKVYAVVGVPAESLRANKMAIKKATEDFVDSLMVVSEPFSAAYGRGVLNNAIVVDIGAGTVDFCIMHGSMPADDDQRTIVTAGDYVDQQLFDMLKEKYPESDFNMNMVRSWKEQYSFVGNLKTKVEVEIPVGGKPMIHDITSEVKRACEGIIPGLLENTLELIARFDPEYQGIVRNNIILAGGGSQIRGLAKHLENELKEDGSCKVSVVEDPVFAGADGALSLAKDMPDKYWEDMIEA
jgi:rod shape-determining protein MreB